MSHVFDYLTRGTDISIISTHHCKYCDDQFILTSLEKELYDRQGFCYPDHCPKCNFRLLYAYINDSHLYYIKDSFHGNTVISTIYSGYPGKIMEAKEYKKQILDDVGLQYAQEI
ncbi:MAG: hypothetical protein H6767_03580 [Candidatus Peribacteria bacterium]|nr:MAG: hypothetical protein H6767_03580 [Candidatus Peribacteria bacterium]